MEDLLKKLNFSYPATAHLHQPPAELSDLSRALALHSSIAVPPDATQPLHFALLFVTNADQINDLANYLAPLWTSDAVVWFAYPKASSKRYKSSINRDKGWASLGSLQTEPVRQVALNDDWSALRFRKVAYIKQLKRHPDGFLSTDGRNKAHTHPTP